MNPELLKILLSGVTGAMFATIGNHLFTRHRETIKLRTERLEGLLTALTQLEERLMGRSLMLSGQDHHAKKLTIAEVASDDLLHRIEAFARLHFTDLLDQVSRLKKLNIVSTTEFVRAGELGVRYTDEAEVANNMVWVEVHALTDRILANHPALVGHAWPRLQKWWCRKCAGL